MALFGRERSSIHIIPIRLTWHHLSELPPNEALISLDLAGGADEFDPLFLSRQVRICFTAFHKDNGRTGMRLIGGGIVREPATPENGVWRGHHVELSPKEAPPSQPKSTPE